MMIAIGPEHPTKKTLCFLGCSRLFETRLCGFHAVSKKLPSRIRRVLERVVVARGQEPADPVKQRPQHLLIQSRPGLDSVESLFYF